MSYCLGNSVLFLYYTQKSNVFQIWNNIVQCAVQNSSEYSVLYFTSVES